MSTVRHYRSILLACAIQWFLVGLQLADLIRGVENDSVRHVKIIIAVGFGFAGLISFVQLWQVVPASLATKQDSPAT